MARSNFKTVDEYLCLFPDEIKNRLIIIRNLIKETSPKESVETISYQIPCFKLNGKFIIYFAGYKNHISPYPIPPGPKEFEEEIEPLIAGKETLQFLNNKELPIKIIKDVIKYSIEANKNRIQNK